MSHFLSYPCSKPASDFLSPNAVFCQMHESGPTWLNLLAFSSHPLSCQPFNNPACFHPLPLHLSSLFFPCTCAQLTSLSLSLIPSLFNVTLSARSSRTSLFTLHLSTHPGFPLYHSSPHGGNLLDIFIVCLIVPAKTQAAREGQYFDYFLICLFCCVPALNTVLTDVV